MLWTISLFLGSAAFAAVVGTVRTYNSDDCTGDIQTEESKDEYDMCSDWLDDLYDLCEDESGDLCDELTSFPLCLEIDDEDWLIDEYQDDVEESISFECEEASDAPTYSPTDPTCTDLRQNGEEEGIDCGGSCDPCPASCENFDCGISHYLRDDPEDINCESDVCNTGDDLDTCCIARALCSTLSNCPTDEVLIVASNSTYCQDDRCSYSDDAATCCTAAGNCDGFTLCNSETQYLKDSPESYICDSVVCDASDISRCCYDKAPCSSYVCYDTYGLINKANSENIYCEYNDCQDDSNVTATCCEDRESCSAYICPDYNYVNKSDKDSYFCGEATCGDNDWSLCCDAKHKCYTDLYRYECSDDALFDLSSRARDLYCDDTVCVSPLDDANCCIEDVPTSYPTPTPSHRPTFSPTPLPSRAPTRPPSPVPTLTPGTTAPPTFTLSPTSTPTSTPTSNPTTQPSAAPSAASEEVEDCDQYADIDSTFSAIWDVEIEGACIDEDNVGSTTDVIATYLSIPCSWVNIRQHSENIDSWNVIYEIFWTDERIADDLENDVILNQLGSHIDEALGCDSSLSLETTAVLVETLDTDPGNDSGLTTGIIIVIVLVVVIFIAVISVAVYKVRTNAGKKTMGQLVEM